MPFIEQLLFGVDNRGGNPARTVLAHSPGMGKEAADEIVRSIENWGTAPPLGLEQPALMSFQMNASIPALPGRLYTVIRGSKGINPLFHAVVISEGAYATFMRNPFAVAHEVDFCNEWNPQVMLTRQEITYNSSVPLVDPLPGKEDIGLVDEAVLKLIADGKLVMPIEQANGQSDRCLALIIACMPEKDRKTLRFASFAPSKSNDFNLIGLQTDGCVFAGWQRMMMTWLAGEYVEEVDTYIATIRSFLEKGDIAGIARTSQRHQIHGSPPPGAYDAPRRDTVSAAMPTHEPVRRQPVMPLRSVLEPMASAPMTKSPAAAGDNRSGVRSKSRKLSPLKKKRAGPRAGTPNWKFTRTKFLRGALALVVLAAMGTAAVMWVQGKTLAESLEWANLQQLMGDGPRTERAATLLEVVDVGEVYGRQLKQMSGAGKGLNPSVDKGRNKALGHLREDAAEPLGLQVNLFAKLAGDGIQQAGRPDRETQRMKSLASQGLVLHNELARLELAWHSLASAVFWQDLTTMSDEAVIARRDSLAKADKVALEDARGDLGTSGASAILESARVSVDGMASLLTLFEADTWSRKWEKKLVSAAGQVSTSASRLTRAYANSAFAYMSLKKAEKAGAQAVLPYRRELKDQDWPSAEVRSLLTNLRAQAVMFPEGQAPSLLTGTLDLYGALKKPVSLAAKAAESSRVMKDLTFNRAARFHPEAYTDFIERIRYEAAVITLEGTDDLSLIPDFLYEGQDRGLVVAFRDTISIHHTPAAWDSLAATVGRPFLARWAGHQAAVARVHLEKAQEEFDTAWIVCRQTAVRLKDEANAGRDWTAAWVELNERSRNILTAHARALSGDQGRAMKMADLTNLSVALQGALPLGFQAGTIRLDQDVMADATKAFLQVKVVPDGETWRSDRFYIGPASPEGAGWVGTVALEQILQIRPTQGLEITIISDRQEETLLTVTCPSLNEGTGPGGMLRPRAGDHGSVSLKFDSNYWKSLRVPDLGMIF